MLNVVVENVNGVLVTTSNRVAEELGIAHKNLLTKIDDYVEKFRGLNFSHEILQEYYIQSFNKVRGRNYRNYLITKKGIAQLIGGYSSAVEKAFELNVAYINKFDEMEKLIYSKGLLENCCQKKLSYDDYIPTHRERIESTRRMIDKEIKNIEREMKNIHESLMTIKGCEASIKLYMLQV